MDAAVRVIRATDRENPADAVLRREVARLSGVSEFDRREVAETVFTYFRWLGWLDSGLGMNARIRSSRQLDLKFRQAPETGSLEELRARSVPAWLLQEMECPEAWLRTLQRPPTLWLRARIGHGARVAARLGHARQDELVPEALAYAGTSDLFQSPEFHAGEFEIQDIASQLVSILCSPKPGETWWDTCAGEGGKTMHLSDLMENKGLIWASDRAEWRLKNLKRRAARAKVFNYRGALWDGGSKLPTKTKFDGVLVDAPCSGVGTWQRNPHARWTSSPTDVSELAEVQKSLLVHAAAGVKPGGKLVYSVCTLTRAETEQVAGRFSETHSGFEPLVLTLPVAAAGSRRGFPSAAAMTIWPQDWGGNGMYVAAWRRKT